jgi:REP element-mobilizing transposase RayT
VDFGGVPLSTSTFYPAIFVVKFSPMGSYLWNASFAPAIGQAARATAVAVDGDGNPEVTGYFSGKSFLKLLCHVNKRYKWICHAYCLMDNHYHILIETLEGNLSIGMRQLNGMYTQAFNRRHNRVGHLFQGRFKAIVIQKDSHLLEVCRYVVLNPVRAKVVEKPEQWKWSSYRAMGGMEKAHPCLTIDWVLRQFGKIRDAAEREYQKFVRAGINGESIWKDVRAQSILGEDDFVERLSDYVKGRKDIPEIPKSQRYMQRPPLEKIFSENILQDRRKRDRKIAQAVEAYGYSQREISDYLGMHFTSISRIMRKR